MPARGNSEQWFRDRLARAEERQAELVQAAAELAAEFAELRRAMSPGRARHTAPKRPRRGDTTTDRWLRAVKVALITFLGLAAVLALMAPRHMRDQQFSPRRTVQVAHLDSDGDYDGTP